ncbi:MAG TPA: RNA 2',3'-cyclic phosphodiesterase [Thermoplasmata archaeon]|nr:RNA 2',3'-cyclic phosphodiesterase [Thermoplasmata archaeon]
MRAFIAIEVPVLAAEVPWPRPPERHLTLRFFADLPDARVGSVEAAMTAASSTPAFELEFRGAGCFPDTAHPRVAWVGVGSGAVPLRGLAARLSDELERQGFPPELRPFVPHVTVLRIRGDHDARRAREMLNLVGDRPVGTTRVDRIVLFESRLGRGGAEHLLRSHADLGRPLGQPSPGGPS